MRRTFELYLVVIKGQESGPGRVLAMLDADACDAAVSRFRDLRPVAALPAGARLDALPARLSPNEGRWRSWIEERTGAWLYPPEITAEKIASYRPPVEPTGKRRRARENKLASRDPSGVSSRRKRP